MEFKLLYPSKGVHILNPVGSIVIVTLWSPAEQLLKQLHPKMPIACVGGLYGGGLNILLRNLLYNPQIDTVLIFGKELGKGSEYLTHYFNGDIYPMNKLQEYRNNDTNEIIECEQTYIRTADSKYTLDKYLVPNRFDNPLPKCINLSTQGISDIKLLVDFLQYYSSECWTYERKISPPLTPVVSTAPSNIFGHTVVKDTVLDAWEEVLFKLHRFGEMTTLRNNKTRKELLNLKVVINNPCKNFTGEVLDKYGLCNHDLDEYAESLLHREIPSGQTYSYGHRINGYFDDYSNLLKVIDDLSLPGDRRRCYLTLWDNTKDITSNTSRPCLTSLWFRKINNTIHMTVTFRTHNGALAWAKNAFGLARVLKFVCSCIDTGEYKPGTLTIISNSISLDPNSINQITSHIDNYKAKHPRIVIDPYGFIKISIDKDSKSIIVIHSDHDNNELGMYHGSTPQEVQHQLYMNQCISDIGHAMYIGTQLEKAYICLNNDIDYVQDKKIIKL